MRLFSYLLPLLLLSCDESAPETGEGLSVALVGAVDGALEWVTLNSSVLGTLRLFGNATEPSAVQQNASVEAYQELIRSAVYLNTAAEPLAGTRELRVTLTDPAGGTVTRVALISVRHVRVLILPALPEESM